MLRLLIAALQARELNQIPRDAPSAGLTARIRALVPRRLGRAQAPGALRLCRDREWPFEHRRDSSPTSWR
jgi:hypothetical protein